MFGKEESLKTELQTAEFINNFVFNNFNNLEISKYLKYESFMVNIEDKILRVISKYKNHHGIAAI